MENLPKCLIPTPTAKSSIQKYTDTNSQCAFAANSLLKTINLSQENIREWAILDSGATSHFLVVDAPCQNIQPALIPLTVRQPDGAQVRSSHTCSLNIDTLPKNARVAHVIPGLASHSLLSVVRLCNSGCEVVFTKIDCYVKYRGRTVLRGYKCNRTGLWMVNLRGCMSEPTNNHANHLLAQGFANATISPIDQIATSIANDPEDSLIIANRALRKLLRQKPTKATTTTTQNQRAPY